MIEAFKRKLKSGEPVLVINPDHPHPSLVEFLGTLPIDAVFIDCEQGSADVETVENMARAARLANLVSLVRIFSAEDWVIERYLGRGVDGLVVPRLETVEQAANVVAAVRYCYPKTSDHKVIVIQIETDSALGALDDMLQIDGIDAYFIGPVDLSKSLGFEGDFRNPEMQDVIARTVSAIRGAGQVAGVLVDQQSVRGYVNDGVQFLYGHVNELLGIGTQELVRKIRGG